MTQANIGLTLYLLLASLHLAIAVLNAGEPAIFISQLCATVFYCVLTKIDN